MKALLLLLSLNASAQDTTRRDTIWIDKIDSSRFKIIVTNLRTGKSDTTVSHVLGNGGYAPKKKIVEKMAAAQGKEDCDLQPRYGYQTRLRNDPKV